MTTIAGLIRTDGGPCGGEEAGRLQQALEIFRPEVRRVWRQGAAALVAGLRRFTPEDAYDRQPLVGRAGRSVLLFCGRLDNREELAGKLATGGAQFGSSADSALVLAAWETWGDETPRHLLGDYVLAVWAPQEQRLFLARDPMGMRPLYWHRGAGLFAFASSAQTLHALPEIPRELDEERLAEFLALSPWVGPASFFKGIQRLEPGQWLALHRNELRTGYHHRFDPERRIVLPSDGDYLEAFREQVERAVTSQTRAVGPVAAHLSSGFDSATVCAVAARSLASRSRSLLAYTHVPRAGVPVEAPAGRHGDEGPGASALARLYPNIEHTLVHNGGSHLEEVGLPPQYSSRPVLNPSNSVWYSAICNMAAARGARVILTGERGNVGLSHHGRMLLPALLRQGRLLRWFREASALHRSGTQSWKGVMKCSFGPYVPEWVWAQVDPRRKGDMAGLFRYSALRPEVARALDIRGRAAAGSVSLSYKPKADSRLARCTIINRTDIGDKYLGGLFQGGVDERSPLADVRLLEFCMAIPDEQFLRDGREKWLLRRAFGDLLPTEILNSPTKGKQSSDWHVTAHAEREAMRQELDRLAKSPLASRLLDIETLRRDLESWPAGGWGSGRVIQRYKLKLLRGLSVGVFIRMVEGDNA